MHQIKSKNRTVSFLFVLLHGLRNPRATRLQKRCSQDEKKNSDDHYLHMRPESNFHSLDTRKAKQKAALERSFARAVALKSPRKSSTRHHRY